MPSQPSLRPFDIAVALRLILVPEDRYEPLANALATSTSAVHRAVARLQQAGLCGAGSRTVNKESLLEFLTHGVRYTFPPIHGPERTGLPTVGAHPALQEALGEDAGPRLVWPAEGGAARGEALTPLFTGMTRVAQRDSRMHELLAIVDLLRVGNPAQREKASAHLHRKIMGDPSPN